MTYGEALDLLQAAGIKGGIIHIARYAAGGPISASREATAIRTFLWHRDIEKSALPQKIVELCEARIAAAPRHRDGYILK